MSEKAQRLDSAHSLVCRAIDAIGKVDVCGYDDDIDEVLGELGDLRDRLYNARQAQLREDFYGQ